MKTSIHTKQRAVFVERLKRAREEAGLTQTQVAKKFGCTQSWISKIELGELRVETIRLQQFAKLYGKPMSYFVK